MPERLVKDVLPGVLRQEGCHGGQECWHTQVNRYGRTRQRKQASGLGRGHARCREKRHYGINGALEARRACVLDEREDSQRAALHPLDNLRQREGQNRLQGKRVHGDTLHYFLAAVKPHLAIGYREVCRRCGGAIRAGIPRWLVAR